jgi:hypothetical protein
VNDWNQIDLSLPLGATALKFLILILLLSPEDQEAAEAWPVANHWHRPPWSVFYSIFVYAYECLPPKKDVLGP